MLVHVGTGLGIQQVPLSTSVCVSPPCAGKPAVVASGPGGAGHPGKMAGGGRGKEGLGPAVLGACSAAESLQESRRAIRARSPLGEMQRLERGTNYYN